MADIWKDFVKQTVSAVASAGTGAFTLSSAVSGFQALAAGDDAGTGFFVATEGTKWQTFFGTYTHSGTSLARTTPIDGSAGVATNETFTTAAVVYLDIVSSAAKRMSVGAIGSIVGLDPKWTSATVLGASSGSCYIESLGYSVYGAPADITPGSPTASTWYHVYAFVSAGVLTLEAVTTAPVAFAVPVGTARSKSGDTTRRYLYSAKTNASNTFYRFVTTGYLWKWLAADLASAPFRVLSNGSATTATAVDCSAVVPMTSNTLIAQFQMLAAGNFFVGSADYTVANNANEMGISGTTGIANQAVTCSSTQNVSYILTSGTSGAYMDVQGFYLRR